MKLTQTEAAGFCGVTARTIRSWTAHDGFPRDPDGSYDSRAVGAWFSERVRAEGVAEGRRLERQELTADVELRKQLALARKYEVQTAAMEGRFVDLGESLELFEGVLSRIRAAMLATTGRLIPLLTRYTPAEALAIVDPVVHESMEAASMVDVDDDEDA